MKFTTRKIKESDLKQLVTLYKKSAGVKDGLARTPDEITVEYMSDILKKTLNGGVGLLIADGEKIIACLVSYKYGIDALKHTLGNMSLAVDPDYFGQGLGKKIFEVYVDEVSQNRSDIARVELHARQSNELGIKIYQSVGFVIEGVQRNRILDSHGNLSNDVVMAWLNEGFKREGWREPSGLILTQS